MEIFDALQRHGDTLEALTLNAPCRDLKEDPETEVTHFEGFKSMNALRNLSVPSYLLIGGAGVSRAPFAREWEITGDFTYPALRDVLPPNLKELEIEMRPGYIWGANGIEEVLLSAVHSEEGASYSGDSSDNSLLETSLVFKGLSIDNTIGSNHLPLDFRRVEQGYDHAGAGFTYTTELSLGAELFMATVYDRLDFFAQMLSLLGPQGVQVALRIETAEPAESVRGELEPVVENAQPRRVMEILGLGPEIAGNRKAKEILFGETFNYNDCGPLGDRSVSTYYADALRRVATGEVSPGGPPTIINKEEFLQALAEAEAQAQDEDSDDDEDSDENKDSDDDEIHGD